MDNFNSNKTTPISSELLLGRQSQLLIAHKAAVYELRLTKQDKLILTKLENNESDDTGLKV